jgi:hypothetical protein
VLFAHAQVPRFQLERAPALFADQRHRRDPFRVGRAGVLAFPKPTRISDSGPTPRQQSRDVRATQARSRTEPLPNHQARLHRHHCAALFARFGHRASISASGTVGTTSCR